MGMSDPVHPSYGRAGRPSRRTKATFAANFAVFAAESIFEIFAARKFLKRLQRLGSNLSKSVSHSNEISGGSLLRVGRQENVAKWSSECFYSSAGSGPAPSHEYQNVGSYTAVLTVTDNLGATATAQVGITVSANPSVINAPSSLTGTAGKGTAKLNWLDNSANETGFYVERAPQGSTNFTRIATVGGNVKTFTNTIARGNYLYRVQAFHATAVSAYSNTVTVRVK